MSNMVKNKPVSLVMPIVFFLMGMVSYAQTIVPQSINSGGTKMSQTNGSVSFVIGDLAILTFTDSNGNTLGSGFTNSATGSTIVTSVNIPNKDILNVCVYPNPTTDLLTIDVVATRLLHLIVEITDLRGKTIGSSKYAGLSNKIGINTAGYAAGTYLLLLKNESGQLLGNYKIIKK